MNDGQVYDIALSFAGEDREYVDEVAHLLKAEGVCVFYDRFDEVNLWGKNLDSYLSEIYLKRARFTVMFISKAYSIKAWPTLERRAAQAKAFQTASEYILPARFDDTEVPGMLPTTGYISLTEKSPRDLVSIILTKLTISGATIPSEFVRRDLSASRSIQNPNPFCMTVRVESDLRAPICGSTVVALAENNTYLSGTTNADGIATLDVHVRRAYRLLVAHPEFPAAFQATADPTNEHTIRLVKAVGVGSVIIHSTGHIPSLSGRLNPILDTSNRTYLYANNIAIDGGKQQPVNFKINEPMKLEDADGRIFYVVIKYIAGQTSLLQFLRSS